MLILSLIVLRSQSCVCVLQLPVYSAEGQAADKFVSHDLERQGRKWLGVAGLPGDCGCSVIHISSLDKKQQVQTKEELFCG